MNLQRLTPDWLKLIYQLIIQHKNLSVFLNYKKTPQTMHSMLTPNIVIFRVI